MDDFVHCLFGLGLAVLTLCMRSERAEADAGRAGVLFPGTLKPGRGRSYPWGDIANRGQATPLAHARTASGLEVGEAAGNGHTSMGLVPIVTAVE